MLDYPELIRSPACWTYSSSFVHSERMESRDGLKPSRWCPHENWNRYFDPATGRYFSPEPLLQSPKYVAVMSSGGTSVSTYAYAANNPLRYVDRNGLWYSVGTWDPEDVDLQNYIWREIGRAAMDPIIGPKVLEMWASPKEFKIWGLRKFGDSETSSKTPL